MAIDWLKIRQHIFYELRFQFLSNDILLEELSKHKSNLKKKMAIEFIKCCTLKKKKV